MNVIFLLLTTVSAGHEIAAPAAPIVHAPAHAAPIVSSPSCGTGGCGISGDCGACSDCCATDCCKPPRRSLFSRCKKARPACCTSCDSCGTTACGAATGCGCEPACPTTCCKPPRRKLFSRRSKACCAPACDTCGSGCADGSCGTGVIAEHGHHAGPIALPAAPGHAIPSNALPHGAPGTIVPGTITPGNVIPNTPTTTTNPDVKGVEPIKTPPKIEGGKGASLTPMSSSVTPTGAKIETEVKNPFELDRRYEKRVSRAADYSKMTGQLYFVHADGGLWVLRYAPLSEEDSNGGSVVLARDRMMNSYREGDLVAIEGQIISQRGSTRLGGPLYQVRTISLVDRPRQ